MHPERERLLKLAQAYLDAIRPRIDALPVGEPIGHSLLGEQRTINNELWRAIATVIYALREPEK